MKHGLNIPENKKNLILDKEQETKNPLLDPNSAYNKHHAQLRHKQQRERDARRSNMPKFETSYDEENVCHLNNPFINYNDSDLNTKWV